LDLKTIQRFFESGFYVLRKKEKTKREGYCFQPLCAYVSDPKDISAYQE